MKIEVRRLIILSMRDSLAKTVINTYTTKYNQIRIARMGVKITKKP